MVQKKRKMASIIVSVLPRDVVRQLVVESNAGSCIRCPFVPYLAVLIGLTSARR